MLYANIIFERTDPSVEKKKPSAPYRLIKWLVWLFYPQMEVIGAENLPDEPAIIVGNHSQLHGPIACELYFPTDRYTWCAGEMMQLKEVPAYAYQDFWAGKPRYSRWFYRLLSYIIAPLSVCVFNNAQTIGVYRDSRIMSTFKNTVKCIQGGISVVIFPECATPHNHIVYSFQENFVDVAKLCYKRTGRAPAFVPLYIAPNLRQMHIGKPVYFDPAAPIAEERHRICREMMDAITALATALPRHTVVPYPNLPKKLHPTNIPEDVPYEKTGT